MFHVNQEGQLSIDLLNKNEKLVRVNGMIVLTGKVQLCEGDVLTIGRYASLSWMTFHVKAKRVVTPETTTKSVISTTKGSTTKASGKDVMLPMKKLIKRRRESSLQSTLAPRPPAVEEKLAWLKTAPNRRRPIRQQPEASPEVSSPVSQRSLFSSLESEDLSKVSHRLTPSPAKRRSQILDLTPESVGVEVPRKRPRYCVSPGKRSKQWMAPLSCSQDAGELPHTTSPVLQPQPSSSEDGKKGLETQAARSPSPCSVRESPSLPAGDTWLTLPQCPSYEDDSTSDEHGKNGEQEFENGEQEYGVQNTKQGSARPQAPKERMANELTNEEWRGMEGGDVRKALAAIVLSQRSKQSGDAWLPDMLQNAIVEIERL